MSDNIHSSSFHDNLTIMYPKTCSRRVQGIRVLGGCYYSGRPFNFYIYVPAGWGSTGQPRHPPVVGLGGTTLPQGREPSDVQPPRDPRFQSMSIPGYNMNLDLP